jgi:hypothetical protein
LQKIKAVTEKIGEFLKGLGFEDIECISGITLMTNHEPEGGHVASPQPLHTDGTFSIIIPLDTDLKLIVVPGSHRHLIAVCHLSLL